MAEAPCPHCEAILDLPDNTANVFTCLSCGQQFGWLPDEGEGMEAEVVPLAPDPKKDEPDAYERKVLSGFKVLGGLAGLIAAGLLTAFFLFLMFIIALAQGISEVSV